MDTFEPDYQDVKFITAEEDPSAPPVRPETVPQLYQCLPFSQERENSSALIGIPQRSSIPDIHLTHS